MQLRLVGSDCHIALKKLTDRHGESRLYLLCQTELRGLPCPRAKKGGKGSKKPFELCQACFESISYTEFLSTVVYPSYMEEIPQLLPTVLPPKDETTKPTIDGDVTFEAGVSKLKGKERKARAPITHLK